MSQPEEASNMKPTLQDYQGPAQRLHNIHLETQRIDNMANTLGKDFLIIRKCL